MIEVLSGNTIRLYSYFYDMENPNKLIDPDEIIFTLYDQKWSKISETILSIENKKSLGVYFYDYITPSDLKMSFYNYEFKGLISGKPSLNRDDFKVVPKK